MDSDIESRFCCFINILSLIDGTVGKEGAGDAFSDIGVLIIFEDAEFLIIDIDFYSFHEGGELVFDISSSS